MGYRFGIKLNKLAGYWNSKGQEFTPCFELFGGRTYMPYWLEEEQDATSTGNDVVDILYDRRGVRPRHWVHWVEETWPGRDINVRRRPDRL